MRFLTKLRSVFHTLSQRIASAHFRQLILFLLIGAVGSCSAKHGPTTLVRRIDHIMIRTGHPRELFAFFTEVLHLPVAWPMDTRGGVTSGGAGFGNVNVEAIQVPDQTVAETKLVGFAFEPGPLDTVLSELQRRRIRFGAPRPFYTTSPDGTRRNLWTNVTFIGALRRRPTRKRYDARFSF